MTMRPLRATNDAVTTLASDISDSATTLSVAAGAGALFPNDNFVITIDSEIILVGSRSSDSFSSLTRGYESTTAAAHTTGAVIAHRFTAGTLRGLYDMFGAVHIAKNENEVSTNSGTTVELMTFGGLSIPASIPIVITGLARKSAGAAFAGQLGFSLNATVFNPSGGSVSTLSVWSSSTTDQAEHGSFRIWIPPRRANYLRAGHGSMSIRGGSTSTESGASPTHGADMPTATITDIGIRGRQTGSTSVTVYVRDVNIYIMREADK